MLGKDFAMRSIESGNSRAQLKLLINRAVRLIICLLYFRGLRFEKRHHYS